MIELHNRIRIDRQLRPLLEHPGLLKAAKQHALYMSNRRRLTHSGPWFQRVNTRVSEQVDEKLLAVAENIAFDYQDNQIVFESWMKSTAHRLNILDARFTHMAWASSGPYHCVVFASFSS